VSSRLRIQSTERSIHKRDYPDYLCRKQSQDTLDRPRDPALVGKDELFKRVWPDASVSDAVLTHCIAEVRQVLQDEPRTPQYIKTISRTGYKFIGKVEEIKPDYDKGLSEGKPDFSIAVLPFENMSASKIEL
jgi:DNA-binding winged helix-turn-helix (wHTH) protein